MDEISTLSLDDDDGELRMRWCVVNGEDDMTRDEGWLLCVEPSQ